MSDKNNTVNEYLGVLLRGEQQFVIIQFEEPLYIRKYIY